MLQAALRVMTEDYGARAAGCSVQSDPRLVYAATRSGRRWRSGSMRRLPFVATGRSFFDLRSAAWGVLQEAGLPEEHLEFVGGCTMCAPQLFHSYRRDRDRSGRMMGVIRLLP